MNTYSLQLLLRKKAAEELKKEQERKAAERRKVIDERCGQPKDLDSASEGKLSILIRSKQILIMNKGSGKLEFSIFVSCPRFENLQGSKKGIDIGVEIYNFFILDCLSYILSSGKLIALKAHETCIKHNSAETYFVITV